MRFYLDTSVFGGFFDEEFRSDTERLFAEIANGRFSIVVSDVTTQELLEAPEDVRNLLVRVPAMHLDIVTPSDEALALAERYVHEGALTEKFIFRRPTYRCGDNRKGRFTRELEFQAHGELFSHPPV